MPKHEAIFWPRIRAKRKGNGVYVFAGVVVACLLLRHRCVQECVFHRSEDCNGNSLPRWCNRIPATFWLVGFRVSSFPEFSVPVLRMSVSLGHQQPRTHRRICGFAGDQNWAHAGPKVGPKNGPKNASICISFVIKLAVKVVAKSAPHAGPNLGPHGPHFCCRPGVTQWGIRFPTRRALSEICAHMSMKACAANREHHEETAHRSMNHILLD